MVIVFRKINNLLLLPAVIFVATYFKIFSHSLRSIIIFKGIIFPKIDEIMSDFNFMAWLFTGVPEEL